MPGLEREQNANMNGVSDSLIRIELITHFHRNPGLSSNVREIAEAIGRDPSRVEYQMTKLVQLNIFEEHHRNGQKRYFYVPPHSVAAYVVRKNGR